MTKAAPGRWNGWSTDGSDRTLHGAAREYERGLTSLGRRPGEVRRRLAADRPFAVYREWLLPERLALNVLGRHRELTGAGAARHDPVSRSVMFSQVAELATWLRGERA